MVRFHNLIQTFGALILVSQVSAAVINCNCNTAAAVNAAIASANSGDIIRCTNKDTGWSSGTVTLPNNKTLTLDGGGLTNLTATGLLTFGADTVNYSVVSNFVFEITNRYAITTPILDISAPNRLCYCRFTTPTSFPVANMGLGSSSILIDHITVTNMPDTIQFIEPNWHNDFNTPGFDSGWLGVTNVVIPLPNQLYTTNCVFIEDSTFVNPDGQIFGAATIFEALYGARIILRHCNIGSVMPEIHGNPAPVVSARWYEFYYNYFTNGAICVRGGSGIIFSNYGNLNFFTMLSESTGYPADYQVGRGLNQSSYMAYVWGNDYGNPHLNEGGDCSVATANMVLQDRDVGFAGAGTSFPGSPTSGNGYWRQDLNTLYVYSNATWNAQWSPFTYPHPLQNQTGPQGVQSASIGNSSVGTATISK